MEPASICSGEFPAHDFGMRTDEKIGQWHEGNRCIGLGHPPLPIFAVCRGADVGRRSGHIEDLHTPAAYPVGGSRRVRVANANLGQRSPH